MRKGRYLDSPWDKRPTPLWPGESQLVHTIDYLGANHFLYTSDFPHWDNEFPENLAHVQNHPDLSKEVKEKILYKNAKELFAL